MALGERFMASSLASQAQWKFENDQFVCAWTFTSRWSTVYDWYMPTLAAERLWSKMRLYWRPMPAPNFSIAAGLRNSRMATWSCRSVAISS